MKMAKDSAFPPPQYELIIIIISSLPSYPRLGDDEGSVKREFNHTWRKDKCESLGCDESL